MGYTLFSLLLRVKICKRVKEFIRKFAGLTLDTYNSFSSYTYCGSYSKSQFTYRGGMFLVNRFDYFSGDYMDYRKDKNWALPNENIE